MRGQPRAGAPGNHPTTAGHRWPSQESAPPPPSSRVAGPLLLCHNFVTLICTGLTLQGEVSAPGPLPLPPPPSPTRWLLYVVKLRR